MDLEERWQSNMVAKLTLWYIRDRIFFFNFLTMYTSVGIT